MGKKQKNEQKKLARIYLLMRITMKKTEYFGSSHILE